MDRWLTSFFCFSVMGVVRGFFISKWPCDNSHVEVKLCFWKWNQINGWLGRNSWVNFVPWLMMLFLLLFFSLNNWILLGWWLFTVYGYGSIAMRDTILRALGDVQTIILTWTEGCHGFDIPHQNSKLGVYLILAAAVGHRRCSACTISQLMEDTIIHWTSNSPTTK